MSPSKVRLVTVMQKSTLVDDMLAGLSTLPLTSLEAFRLMRATRPRQSRSYAAPWKHCLILGVIFWPRGLASGRWSTSRSRLL